MEEKKKKGKWDETGLQTAITKVLSKELSLREAASCYNIPKSTLHDRTSALNRGEEVTLKPKVGRFTKTFPPEYEQVLVEHVKDLSNRCLPLMKQEFLKLAFDLAESLKIPHHFNKEKGVAGKHFYYDFMERHPDLSLRAPESTSMMRAVGFNKPQVDLFYDNIERLMTLHKFPPSNIYNCDETGVSCVHKHKKVLAPKAVRQVGKLTSAERGKNITVLFCMSANGHFIPPFFVFPRQRMNDRLMINAPAESVGVAQPKGWMNSDFFLQWLQLFVKHSHPTKENPVLLLLDGHCSHKTLAVIIFCRDNNTHLISSPPHTTHKLQPLDRTFMKPFKAAYNQRCDMWMRTNAGSRITDYVIAGLVNEAFTKVARLDIAASGFKCTGIYPFDRHLFTDLDYLAADITNIPLEEPGTSSNSVDCSGKAIVSVVDVAESNSMTCNTELSNDLASKESTKPSEDSMNQVSDVAENTSMTRSTELSKALVSKESTDPPKDPINEPGVNLVSEESRTTDFNNEMSISDPKQSTSYDPDIIQIVHKLSPLPDAAKKRSAARKRKCERSEILNFVSPYKIAVEEKENEKTSKEEKKRMKINLKTALEKEFEQTKGAKAKGKGGEKGKQAKETKTKGKSEEKGRLSKEVKNIGKRGGKSKKKQPLVEASQTGKTTCVVCLEDHNEDWLQCSSCHGWAHEACADIPECSEAYICDRCQMF